MSKKAASKTTTPNVGNDQLNLKIIALDMLSTTWRITVPVVIFAGFGIFLDSHYGPRPLFTLLGVAVGFVLAGYMLKQQLKALEQGDKK